MCGSCDGSCCFMGWKFLEWYVLVVLVAARFYRVRACVFSLRVCASRAYLSLPGSTKHGGIHESPPGGNCDHAVARVCVHDTVKLFEMHVALSFAFPEMLTRLIDSAAFYVFRPMSVERTGRGLLPLLSCTFSSLWAITFS